MNYFVLIRQHPQGFQFLFANKKDSTDIDLFIKTFSYTIAQTPILVAIMIIHGKKIVRKVI